MIEQVCTWLASLPANELGRKAELLVTNIRAKRKELEEGYAAGTRKTVKGSHHARAQRMRRDEIGGQLAWKDDTHGAQADWHRKCHDKMKLIMASEGYVAYGLYMVSVNPRWRYEWHAVFRAADDTWLTPKPVTYQPNPLSRPDVVEERTICEFVRLYESLSLPRVPVPFTFDEACLVTDF